MAPLPFQHAFNSRNSGNSSSTYRSIQLASSSCNCMTTVGSSFHDNDLIYWLVAILFLLLLALVFVLLLARAYLIATSRLCQYEQINSLKADLCWSFGSPHKITVRQNSTQMTNKAKSVCGNEVYVDVASSDFTEDIPSDHSFDGSCQVVTSSSPYQNLAYIYSVRSNANTSFVSTIDFNSPFGPSSIFPAVSFQQDQLIHLKCGSFPHSRTIQFFPKIP